MENYRAIPDGYMKVGELAKKAGVTVRTLQYYDKESLLTPSAESEGGYRLYTDKDFVKLLQILMMKRLGFTLGEIKKRIVAMDTTAEVLDVLTEHAANTRMEIDHLTQSLAALESLKEEIVQVDTVDFKKFADILTHLQMKNERYWLVKYLDNDVLDALKTQNDTSNEENAARVIEAVNSFIEEAAKHYDESVPPESGPGQDFAERYWKWIMEVTGGDMDLVQSLNEQATKSVSDEKNDEVMEKAFQFMKSSLESYFSKL
ncbi:MAG: MerR family transcriptional regulator [Oscillospiraceae bacterium]|jgi:DNA-binding transcriptional MerR regulator|nr:MerR family transcriptional regulator [Oscillospiraceae bacterium]